MRVSQWWSYLTGYLSIEVEGERLEPFVNMAMTRGIMLWDLKRESATRLSAMVRISGFYGLRHIARRNRCRLRIKRRQGFPFFAARLRKRKMLVLGSLFFIVLIYYLSSLVWFIEVTGNQQIASDDILRVAWREGLVPGTPSWRLDRHRLEKVLAQEFPEAAFISVEGQGTRITIEVVEKRLPPPDEYRKGRFHVVAARGGVIEDIIVKVGEPQVQPGDEVQAGQILISGILPVPGTGSLTPPPGVVLPPPASLQPENVSAQGVVRAKVWYTAYGESEKKEHQQRKTGRKTLRVHLFSWGRDIILYGPRETPYPLYELQQREARVKDWSATVLWENIEEVEDYVVEHGEAGALDLAIEQGRTEIGQSVMPESETLLEKIDRVPLDDSNRVRVRLQVEAREDIGIRQAF